MTAEHVDVLGVLFQDLTRREAAAEIARLAGEDAKTYVVKPYSEFMPRAHGDERVRDILNGAAMRLADGAGILWAANYLSLPGGRLRALLQFPLSLASLVFRPSALRRPLPEAMAGVDFTWKMLRALAGSGRSVYLLGGTAEESAGAAQSIRERLPSLTIVGAHDAYF
ncbi:MAG: WecB/TagA/CpsF family glycosyltransferase, partial [Chloroflexi bacterium]|nr:WecB/TagA/CpsF family glycosyltransferase [Chloroflexota bacterium]